MESGHARECGAGAIVTSLLTHLAVIGTLASATLDAKPPRPATFAVDTTLIFVPPVTTSHHGGAAQPLVTGETVDCLPAQPPPDFVPPVFEAPVGAATDLPSIDWDSSGRQLIPVPVGGNGLGGGTEEYGAFEIAEHPAAPLPGNPPPEYPSLLRGRRVEGIVTARFVVDTTGRVEAAGIRFDAGSDRLFQESVRRALLASRFRPAQSAGRRVRMLVRQDFVFRLTS